MQILQDSDVCHRNEVVRLVKSLVDHRILQEEEVVEAEEKDLIIVDRQALLPHKARLTTTVVTIVALAFTITIQVAGATCRAITVVVPGVLEVILDVAEAVDFLAAFGRPHSSLSQVAGARTKLVAVLLREEVELIEEALHHTGFDQAAHHFLELVEPLLDVMRNFQLLHSDPGKVVKLFRHLQVAPL